MKSRPPPLTTCAPGSPMLLHNRHRWKVKCLVGHLRPQWWGGNSLGMEPRTAHWTGWGVALCGAAGMPEWAVVPPHGDSLAGGVLKLCVPCLQGTRLCVLLPLGFGTMRDSRGWDTSEKTRR